MSGIVQTLRLNCPFLHLTLMFFPPPQFRASFVFNPSSYLLPSLSLAPAVTTQIFTKTHLLSLIPIQGLRGSFSISIVFPFIYYECRVVTPDKVYKVTPLSF